MIGGAPRRRGRANKCDYNRRLGDNFLELPWLLVENKWRTAHHPLPFEPAETHHSRPPNIFLFHPQHLISSHTMSSIALARVYQQSFEAHPHTTAAITNGALGAFSDIVAQITQRVVCLGLSHQGRAECDSLLQIQNDDDDRERRSFDFARTARFFAFGFGMGVYAHSAATDHVLTPLQVPLLVDGTSSWNATSRCAHRQ
jgi:hypothetical protein